MKKNLWNDIIEGMRMGLCYGKAFISVIFPVRAEIWERHVCPSLSVDTLSLEEYSLWTLQVWKAEEEL